jgi:hypothetical protein
VIILLVVFLLVAISDYFIGGFLLVVISDYFMAGYSIGGY